MGIENLFKLSQSIKMWQHLCLMGTKVYISGPGHMTKMASMPIYGKNPLKIFPRTVNQMTLKLGR